MRITGQIVADLEKGVRPWVQALERRTRRRPDYAPAAAQRPALQRNQHSFAVDVSHRAEFRGAHLDDIPAGP